MKLPSRLGIDTDCLAYYAESHGSPRQAFIEREVFIPHGPEVVASMLTLSEILVKRYQRGSVAQANEARAAFEAMPGLTWVSTSADIAQEAARLRAANTRLRLPDAINIATAVAGGAGAFLTNDVKLKQHSAVAGLPIHVLDELAGLA